MNFESAVEHILAFEGGYVFDGRDPGGETKFGISKRAYPALDIKNLSEDDARKIYLRDYWLPLKLDELPPRIRLCLFDCAVNQGTAQAIKFLQSAVGTKADGIIGPLTIAAAKNKNDIDTLSSVFLARLVHYTKLPHWDHFGRGWSKRLIQVAMASVK